MTVAFPAAVPALGYALYTVAEVDEAVTAEAAARPSASRHCACPCRWP